MTRSAPPEVRVAPSRTAARILAAGLLTAGCAASPVAEPPTRPVWPPPPEVARIEHVRSLTGEGDVPASRRRWLDFLGGESPTPLRLAEPLGLAVTDDGTRLYVADPAQGAVLAFDLARGGVSRVGGDEPLGRPTGLAVDADGRLYVAEQMRRVVQVFDLAGQRVATIGHPTLERPVGLALDRARGRLYVVDTGSSRSTEHTVKVFDATGSLVGVIGRGKGVEPGQFLFPTYAAVDRDGRLYVTDTINGRVQIFDPEGRLVGVIGARGTAWGMFDVPKGLALDTFGHVYVVDSGWSNVQIFDRRGRVLLFFGGRGPLPGMLKNPTAIAIDRENRIYVADFMNHRVEVYRLVNTTAEETEVEAVRAEVPP